MRFARFTADGFVSVGAVDGNQVRTAERRYPLDRVRLLPPALPSKIVCVGRNYREHAHEMGSDIPKEPLLFLKPPSALCDPGGTIVYPRASKRVDYEGELAVVIGARCRNVARANAASVVRGYTIFNDVTARDLQRSDNQWSRAKGFDTFAPLGPWIVDDVDARDLRIRTYLNGELKQDASTRALIFDIPYLIEYASAIFTLEAGDVIATGTPSGVGPMQPGDEVRVEIEGIGALVNRVESAATA
jgi:2-keto-4-pentenoate hydratase/2-oxohepta-3-ene-1,7-dioic acid hydratase in catechol pathway